MSRFKHKIGYCDRCNRRFQEGGGKTLDHIIPRRGFGCPHEITSSKENRQYICVSCHKIKSVIEHWVRSKFESAKNRYLALDLI